MNDKPLKQRSDSEVVLMAAGQYQRSADRLAGEDAFKNAETIHTHMELAERCAKIAARLRRIDKR